MEITSTFLNNNNYTIVEGKESYPIGHNSRKRTEGSGCTQYNMNVSMKLFKRIYSFSE